VRVPSKLRRIVGDRAGPAGRTPNASRMGIRLTLVCALALFASGAASMEMPAAANDLTTPRLRAPVHVLRGHTSFTASTTSRFVARLRKTIPVSSLRRGFSSAGRVSGYVVAEMGPAVGTGLTLDGYAIGRCDTEGCAGKRRGFQFHFGSNVGKFLAPGLYQVFVIADSAPVTVRLRTPELRGRASYRGGEPIRAEVSTLPVGAASQAQGNLFSAGDFVSWDDATPEFGLFGLWMTSDSHAATAFGDCAYTEGSAFRPPVGELNSGAFLPGCPTGDGFEFTRVSDEPGGKSSETFLSARWDSTVGLGGWFSSASEVAAHGAVGIWIDYEN
jgi:hypothetical protein